QCLTIRRRHSISASTVSIVSIIQNPIQLNADWMAVIRRSFKCKDRLGQLIITRMTDRATISLTVISRIGAVVTARRLIAKKDRHIHGLQSGLNSGCDKLQQLWQAGDGSQ